MELRHVDYSYDAPKRQITDFTATVPEGQILTIIGPNGAGKSTLLKLLMGTLPPEHGQVLVDDQPVAQLSKRQRATKIAFVSQQHQVYDEMTVGEVVKTGRLPFHSLLATIPDEEIRPYLTQVHLEELIHRPLQSLSGGQQQRVWLAAALAQEPQYLFLDEPTTYLDIRYQQDLMSLIKELNRTQKITIVLILHDINQAFKISDWIWLIKQGRLVAADEPAKLLDAQLLSTTFGLKVEIVTVPDYGPYIVQLSD